MISEHASGQNHKDLDYIKFRRRLFARRELHWRLLSGSLYERPLLYVLTDPTDLDDLVWPADIRAIIPQRQSVLTNHFQGTLLTVHTKGVHEGFAKLKADAKETVFYEKPRRPVNFISKGDSWTEISKGPSEKKCIKWCQEVGLQHLYDRLCNFDDSWKNVQQVSIDRVEAIYCPSWPPEADEWITRERRNGWPSRDVIEKIVGFGCHLVSKPHQGNPNDFTQWRFSFSAAEVILINSWSDVQKYIYHVLRLIKSDIVERCGGEANTVLCTYFFKTLMLWTCEEKPPEFWTDENLETSMGELLCEMIEWLIERCCRNYFIPRNNMIDHVMVDDDFSYEISFLLHYKEHRLHAMLTNTQKAYPRTEFFVNIPTKLLHYSQLQMIFTSVVNPLQPRMSERLMNEITVSPDFMPVLKALHAGITQHLQLMKSRKAGTLGKDDERERSSSALNSFSMAIEESDAGSLRVPVSLSDSLLLAAEKLTSSTLLNKRTNSTDSNHSNRVGASESDVGLLQVENYKLHILRTAMETFLQNSASVLFVPSYFISAAYRANFFYTGLLDYRSAVRQCNETCKLFDAQYKDALEDITKQVFYLMLTNEWYDIFDENIQTVLGFTALYRSISKVCDTRARLVMPFDNGRIIIVHLHAVEFLRYVNVQCLRLLGRPGTPYLKLAVCSRPVRSHSMFSEKYTDIFSAIFLNAALHSSYA